MSKETQRQAGFSLIELMIAMTVTLIVTGAVFALLTSGQSAFRMQPELTDRQQNIRAAMDRIMRDVHNAGVGTPPFTQIFTPALDGTGIARVGPLGQTGLGNSDILEIFANDTGWDPEPICHAPGGGSSVNVRLVRANSRVKEGMHIMILMLGADGKPNGEYAVREVTMMGSDKSGGDSCVAGTDHDRVMMQKTAINPGGSCEVNNLGEGNVTDSNKCEPYAIMFVDRIRYEIRNDDTGVPCLVRISSNEGRVPVVIARGIEDMQVRYRPSDTISNAAADLEPSPRVIVPNNYTTLTVEVEVTLQARAADLKPLADSPLFTGTKGATDTRGIRGQLTSRGAVRQALSNLYADGDSSPRRWQ